MASDGRPRILRSALAITMLATIGCQQGVTVEVSQAAESVDFAVTPRSGVETCIDSVTVYPDTPADAPPVWSSNRGLDVKGCTTRLRYGAPPDGWGQQVAARPLVKGAGYRVMLGGVGFTGAERFVRQ